MPDTVVNFPIDLERLKSAVDIIVAGRFSQLETHLHELENRLRLQSELGKDVWNVRNAQLDKRLDSMNEFRGAMVDRESSYLTRAEHELSSKVVEADVRALREAAARSEGKASQSNLIVTFLVAAFGSAIAVVDLVLRVLGK